MGLRTTLAFVYNGALSRCLLVFWHVSPSPAQELELMCKMKVKAEIQALSSFDFQYLTHVYLPEKLKEGDWI